MTIDLNNLEELSGTIQTIKKEEEESHKDNIVKEVQKLGCTYPKEIARNLMINSEKVVGLIFYLIKEQRLFRLKLHPMIVPIEMRPRLSTFWSYGIRGFEMFSRMIWVIPSPQIPYSKYYGDRIKQDELLKIIKIPEETIE